MVKRVARLFTAVAVAVLACGSGSAADASPTLCTNGMAHALLQVHPVTAHVMELRGNIRPRLVDARHECSYRVFHDGQHYYFDEGDVILGGVTWLSDYVAAGITRAEAVADIERSVDRVWLAEGTEGGPIGELVEQPLTYTAFKSVISPVLGHVVYQHRAFISQLPPGDYVSVWVNTLPGEPDASATVYLHIQPNSG
jgi:hypothetical protein